MDQGTRVDLSWEPVGGDVFHIDLERRELLDVSSSALGSISAPEQPSWSNWKKIALIAPEVSSFPDFSAGCGKQYEYQLCNNFGNGDRVCSLPIQAATPLCPPKDLAAILVSPGTVELNWTDVSNDEIRFDIYRKTAPSGAYEQIGAVFANITTYTDADLSCCTAYLYKVRAVNDRWESGYSNAASVSTEYCSPYPGDCYVWLADDDATGSGTGYTWEDAFTHPQDAMDAANSCDMIWVAEGTYTSGTTDPVLTMKDGVVVYGGFIGTEWYLSERGDPALFPTTMDGEDLSQHVVIGASNARLDGFTVTGGYAIDSDPLNFNMPHHYGGGMNNKWVSNLTLANCNFSQNYAEVDGGGMFNQFTNDLYIMNCTFSNNSGHFSGAIYNHREGNCEINNCIFTDNIGRMNTGGIVNNQAIVTIKDCTFQNNIAAVEFGGAITNWVNSVVDISGCVFNGNWAGMYGGAISNQHTNTSITESIFSNNYAGVGGGAIFSWHSNPVITNCTITDNQALDRGGALFNDGPSYSTITNSILWGNSAPSSPEIRNQWGSVTVTFSDIQGGWSGTGNIKLDPLFVPAAGDYHLQSGSPCINSGTASGAPSDDLDGNPRPSGAGYDMGAYEFQQ